MNIMQKIFSASISFVFACTALAGLNSCGKSGGGQSVDNSEVVASVSLSKETLEIFVGETSRITATALNADGEKIPGLEVTWASSNDAVAEVSSKGVVSAKADGTANITATINDVVSKACVVTVATRRTVTISQTEAALDLDKGETTLQLTASCSDGGEVTWATSNAEVATVDSTGKVTAIDNNKKFQTVEITATRGEASATCVVSISKTSAPEQYDLSLGNSNANVAANPGKWFYFLKTSGGGTGTVKSGTYTSELIAGVKHEVLEISAYDVSEKQGDSGKDLEWYLRYQPNFPQGSIYTLTFDMTTNVAGKVTFNNGNETEIPANEVTHVVITDLEVNATPLNIKLLIWGGTEDNPINIKLDNLDISLQQEGEEVKPDFNTDVKPEETTIDIERVATEANLISNPDTWGYFLKTSSGSTGEITECKKSESGKTMTLKATNVSATDTAGSGTLFRLRMQPNYAVGSQVTVSGYIKANIDGSVNVGGASIVTVPAGGFIKFEATYTLREKNAFYFQFNFFGAEVDITIAELTITPVVAA